MLLGAKEWGALSLSSRLGLRLSLRGSVFGLLRMGGTVSLFAARSLAFRFAARSRFARTHDGKMTAQQVNDFLNKAWGSEISK